jgi:hypothetical protein
MFLGNTFAEQLLISRCCSRCPPILSYQVTIKMILWLNQKSQTCTGEVKLIRTLLFMIKPEMNGRLGLTSRSLLRYEVWWALPEQGHVKNPFPGHVKNPFPGIEFHL